MNEILKIAPREIEKKSFEIITEELGDKVLPKELAPIIKRVIHTSADFEYADTLYFSDGAVEQAKTALLNGAQIITDTQMAKAGVNKRTLAKLGCDIDCYVADADVAEEAKANGSTRSAAAINKAAKLDKSVIFAIGNAPTALIRIKELMDEGLLKPSLVIGVPVGFVNVVPAKEMIIDSGVPCIVARGRKGGSNVAAAIVNALLYMLDEKRGE